MSELEEFLKLTTEPTEGSPEPEKAEEEAPQEAAPDPAPDQATESTDAKMAEDQKEGEAEGTGEDSTPPVGKEVQKSVPVAALEDERHKRQKAEEEAANLKTQLAAFGGKLEQLEGLLRPKEETPEEPSFLDDPEAAQAAFKRNLQADRLKDKVDASVEIARVQLTDFDPVMNEIRERMAKDPELARDVQALYQTSTATALPAFSFYRSVKRIVGEIKPEDPVEVAETAVKEQVASDLAKAKAVIPETLAEERSVAARSGPAWAGATKDDELQIGKGLA